MESTDSDVGRHQKGTDSKDLGTFYRVDGNLRVQRTNWVQAFDAIVVASGHYHTPRVPDIPGLAKWKRAWPSRIQHTKGYRNPNGFENQVGVCFSNDPDSG